MRHGAPGPRAAVAVAGGTASAAICHILGPWRHRNMRSTPAGPRRPHHRCGSGDGLFTGALPPVLDRAPAADAAPCPDVEIVFARGTTEPPGVGGIGQAFVDSLRSQLGGRSVGVYAVNYPASNDFSSSTPAGGDDMSGHVQAMAANCPNTRMVLGGYSQGAAVVDLATTYMPAGVRTTSRPPPSSAPREVPSRTACPLARCRRSARSTRRRQSRCACPTTRSAIRAAGTCVPTGRMLPHPREGRA